MSEKIQFTLTLENGQFKASTKEGEAALSKLKKEAVDMGKKGTDSTKGFSNTLGGLKTSTLAAWAAVSGMVAAVFSLGKSFLSAGAGAEKSQVAFTTLLKSGDKAKALLSDLQKWSNKTPFEFKDAEQGAKRLLAFGVESENVIDVLTRLGDASMGDAQTLDTLTLAYGKLAAKGKADMESLNMVIEAGVPIMQELADQFGVDTQAIYKMVETGKIGFADVDKALANLTTGAGQFAGMMEQQSQTLSGQWSTFGDTMSTMAKDVGLQMVPAFKDLLFTINNSQTVIPFIKGLFEDLAYSLSALARGATSLISLFERLKNNSASNTSYLNEETKAWDKQGLSVKAQIMLLQNKIVENKKMRDSIAKNSMLKYTTGNTEESLLAEDAALKNLIKSLNSIPKETTKNININTRYNGAKPVETPAGKPAAPAAAAVEQYPGMKEAGADIAATQNIMSQLDGIMQMATDSELARVDLKTQKKLEALDTEYQAEVDAVNKSTLNQEQKAAKLKALDEKHARDKKVIDDKAAKEKRKIEHEAAKRQKAMNIVNAIMATALAIISALQMAPPASFIFAALAGAIGIASIAMIAAQPLPPLATGTPFIPEDMAIQAHQGEAIIPKTFAEGVREGEMTIGSPQTITVYQTIHLDGKEIGQNVEQWLLSKAANRGTSIYNNA